MRRYWLFVPAIMLFLASCAEDTDKDGLTDDLDKCKEVFAKTKDGCPIKVELQKIHFYVETSASMGGYYRNDAEYKTILSDLTIKIDKNIKPIDIWFISDTTEQYKRTVENFSSDIATTKIAARRSSEFHKIFAQIAAKTDSVDISVFISDCILSFPDDEIKKNPQINKTEAPNALKNNIFSTFSELKRRGQSVSIYAFKSKFYGTYYDYQNVKQKLKGAYRPFYVWVIGSTEILKKFDRDLADISSFKPEKEMHFGFNEQPLAKYGLLTQVEKRGEWNSRDGGKSLSDAEVPKNDTLKFCLGLNLDSLPAYVHTASYLESKLQLHTEGCKATFRFKPKSQVNSAKLSGSRQPAMFEKATDILLVSVSKMDLENATLHFSLPVEVDTWYREWSSMDDKDVLNSENKTFAFEYLITGVKDAYDTKNRNYIDFSINISK
jgi:hypothetical protein